MISCFRLNFLKISAYCSHLCRRVFTAGLDLAILPHTLDTLILKTQDALSGIARLPRCALKSVTPSLRTLELESQAYIPEFDRRELIEGLPSSLTNLLLPTHLYLDVATILCLPCHLVSLKVAIYPIKAGEDEIKIRDAAIFGNLEVFKLVLVSNYAWGTIVPPSVKTFLSVRFLRHGYKNNVFQGR